MAVVAREKHLRTIEAALPLPLQARIRYEPNDRRAWCGFDPESQHQIQHAETYWRDWIRIAWPALDEVGAKRTRGFGRLLPQECRDEVSQ